ncbi:MAG: isopeptide-forming domain-containing fimbrial protein [Dehalococcoidia bacterium]|nr:isopeptide-forming domain-containing fimbrial protein [Dehalococcoidia bacterium]
MVERAGLVRATRVIGALLLAVVVAISPLSCQPTPATPATPTTTPPVPSIPTPLTLDGVLQVLLGDILQPAFSSARVSACMPSKPLPAGTVISSESGLSYRIDKETWFAFIDDAPEAFFAHPCRYVFIDAVTGGYKVEVESWPPDINGVSMWDQPGAVWHLVEVFSILDVPMPGATAATGAPTGDYGDAPDGSDAYSGVLGKYPTRYATVNGYEGTPGCHALTTGEETIGRSVSAEVDATDPNDPDGVPNLVDADADERAFAILDGTTGRLAFTVTVAPTAPQMTRYLNVLVDFDQSGTWGPGGNGSEWPVKNLVVTVAPGMSSTVITPPFLWGGGAVPISPVWMRALLSRALVGENGSWDGSGGFTHGEVEDYFVFLMHKPPPPAQVGWPPEPKLPPGGDGGGNGGGPPPPPGPAKGTCGYDIKYHVLVINCGDSAQDLGDGTPIVQSSCDAVSRVTQDQGYTSAGSLSPGGAGDSKTTLANIGKAFDDLNANVKCGDKVLVYICGHGREDGGITIKSPGGSTQEVMKPTDGAQDDGKDNSLEDFLNKIPACPDQDCETAGCCCDVTVILESCFAGNFKVKGIGGEGCRVVGTSDRTESWATYPGGGVYTRGLVEGLRDEDADTDDPPDGVDPGEAHESGTEAISENNKKQGKAQEPWEAGRKCDCKCPCSPDISVDKWVMGEDEARWVTQLEAEPGARVRFRIEIENTGKCRDLVDLQFIDEMEGCLEYEGDATVDIGGAPASRSPDEAWQSSGGSIFIWDLSDLGPLSPGDVIGIEYDAVATQPGANLNKGSANAHCSVDYSIIVVDADIAGVLVQSDEVAPPAPEDVLEVHLELHAESQSDGMSCWGTVTVSVSARDLSEGSYPVKGVVVSLNGAPWYSSGPISTEYFSKTIEFESPCGLPLSFEAAAVNSLGMEATTSGNIITPLP